MAQPFSKAVCFLSFASIIKYFRMFYYKPSIQKKNIGLRTDYCRKSNWDVWTEICCYPCNLLKCVPLRVIKADLLSDIVSCHQTPVNLQVDGHQKQTLGKQINLCKKSRVEATRSAFSSRLKSVSFDNNLWSRIKKNPQNTLDNLNKWIYRMERWAPSKCN